MSYGTAGWSKEVDPTRPDGDYPLVLAHRLGASAAYWRLAPDTSPTVAPSSEFDTKRSASGHIR